MFAVAHMAASGAISIATKQIDQFCGYKGKCWKPCETNGTKQNVVAIVVSIEVILLLIVGLLIIWCWLFRKSQQPAEQNNR